MSGRAVSSWSLHRTLGRFVGNDSAVQGGRFFDSESSPSGLALLDLPRELRAHGYDTLQICHFHFPSRSSRYLGELKSAVAESGIELDALLIDDGDLTDPVDADHSEAWIGEWLDVAIALGARRARVIAGNSAPSPDTTKVSAERLVRLAKSHPEVRLITENWLGMMPNADSVLAVLSATGDSVGLMVDLGNWKGPEKYGELVRIAPFAETVHAKCHFSGSVPDRDDFQRSLLTLHDVGYDGPLALIYDGPDDDEWAKLEVVHALVREVFE